MHILEIIEFYVSEVEIGHYDVGDFSEDAFDRIDQKSTGRYRITYTTCLMNFVAFCREKCFCPPLYVTFAIH